MLSPTLAEDRPRAADPKAVRGTSGLAPGGFGAGLGGAALGRVPAGRVELAGVGGAGAAVPADRERSVAGFALFRGVGRRDGLLAALDPLGPADRRDRLAGLGGDGAGAVGLVAGIPGAGEAGRAPAPAAGDDRGAGALGRPGVSSARTS